MLSYLNQVDWEKDLHLFSLKELHILLDVNSGSVHVLDDVSKEVLNSLARNGGDPQKMLRELAGAYPPQSIIEVLEELESLRQAGTLFTRDEPRDPWGNGQEPYLKSLCLHVAHDCNLRCRYCFGGTGEFGGTRELMGLEVGKRSLNFLLEHSGKRPTCEVDFFGGEPLMNFPVVRELVLYGEEAAGKLGKKFNFTITTNGVLLNKEIEDFLNKHQISAVLSIDGRREINDLMRPLAGGQGSYQRIVPRFESLVRSRDDQNYYLRGTYTHYNLDFSEDVLHLADLGFTSLSVEPVVAFPQADYAFQKEDLPILFQEYERLVDIYLDRKKIGRPFHFFHFHIELEQGPCLPKRLTGCGAGFEYLAVTPAGDLYPCHQFVGRETYRLGDVWQGLTHKELSRTFQEAHIYHKEECRHCWARFYCSGGCHANAEAFNG
ncbi:MAG TPA: thioether cross-link-forming SCIFF peptide maturase, partial [Clostridia bacterium]|nr:thioether cross-link-forming SCIFF peptide maturase [Clostridia bacterium]